MEFKNFEEFINETLYHNKKGIQKFSSLPPFKDALKEFEKVWNKWYDDYERSPEEVKRLGFDSIDEMAHYYIKNLLDEFQNIMHRKIQDDTYFVWMNIK